MLEFRRSIMEHLLLLALLVVLALHRQGLDGHVFMKHNRA